MSCAIFAYENNPCEVFMKSGFKQWGSALLLVLTAMIWGVAFVAQSVGGDSVGPFTFLASRSFIAGVALLPVIAWRNRRAVPAAKPASSRDLWVGGVLCGTALMIASAFQQIGIGDPNTTVGKAGFITALYIVIVPLAGIFMKKKIQFTVWIGVALATFGMYLLCITESLTISYGDVLILICAVCFSVQILLVDYFSPKVDGVKLACLEFFTCGTLSLVMMLITETPTWDSVLEAWMPILYAGLFSSAIGYTLQIVAQKNTPPTLASLLMSLESVFSVLAGWAILGQVMSGRELIGCVLVFAAVLLAQIPVSAFAKLSKK